MKYFLFLVGFLFVGCTTTYVEIYNIEKYPVTWEDVIVYKEDHWHFCDKNNMWQCVELDSDTIYLNCQDTMIVKKLVTKYKVKKNDSRRIK